MSEQTEHTEHIARVRHGQAVLRPARAFCAHAVAKLADFILPPLCLVCRVPVQGHGGLCAKCWPGIDFIEPPRCDQLGIPLPVPSDELVVSAAALADQPVYDRARAVARYDGAMRALVHALKYGDRHEGVKLFSRWMIHAGADVLENADIIVPVPLERIRRTPSQVGLSAEQRRRNVAGAFRVPGRCRAQVAERNIVIVDDVITTGATANACARTLKHAGAARVDVLALARVTDPLTPRL